MTKGFKEKILIKVQKAEITEHIVYKNLAFLIKDKKNQEVLQQISQDELSHYQFWKSLTQKDIAPNWLKVFFYIFIARFLGLTFSIKLLEQKEDSAQRMYFKLKGDVSGIEKIIQDEEKHESQLIDLIDEERLKYISSVVLGLNDALVELTGALAGLTLALQNTRLIAVVGLITGIAASMSMAASEYLSTRQEDTTKSPLKASLYTGVAYILTVIFLIIPYLIFKNVFLALAFVVINSLLVITIFTYYISVAKDLSFKKRFFEMAGISLTIAVISFFIGLAIRKLFGVEA